MPTKRFLKRSSILDRTGQPFSTYLYPTPRTNIRNYRPRYNLSRDIKKNINEGDRAELVNYSRQLFAQIGNLNTAIRQKNSWAFGDAWDAHFVGQAEDWGKMVEEWLKEQWYPNACVRGPNYPFKRCLELSGKAWDVDGDDVMVLTEAASGFPQLAFYPATRIGTGQVGASEGVVTDGPYKGYSIFDGIIYNDQQRAVAIRILGDEDDFTDISTFSADLAYEPDWSDQFRGVPRVSVSLLRWMNLQDIDEFLQRGMKRAASIGLLFKNEAGEAGLGNEVITEEEVTDSTGETRTVHYEEVRGGSEMYYLQASTGESIEALKYDNPHPNSEAFVERIVRESLASVGWFYELLNMGSTGRAPTRMACDIANQSIWDRQSTGERRAKRALNYAIAKAIKSKILPPNPVGGADTYRWEFGLPKQLSVDAGNDEQADRENLKLGTTSKTLIAQKKGWHRRDIEKQRLAEVRDLIRNARMLSQETPEITFDKAMDLLEQRSPNGVQQQQQAPEPTAADTDNE